LLSEILIFGCEIACTAEYVCNSKLLDNCIYLDLESVNISLANPKKSPAAIKRHFTSFEVGF